MARLFFQVAEPRLGQESAMNKHCAWADRVKSVDIDPMGTSVNNTIGRMG